MREPGGIFTDPFAPTLEPFGRGSSLAFFLCETPEGPAAASSSCSRPKMCTFLKRLRYLITWDIVSQIPKC